MKEYTNVVEHLKIWQKKMKNNKEYYRICFNITPSYCRSITYTAVISEPFEHFVKRHQESKYGDINVFLIQKCTKKEYNIYKKFNPPRTTYAKLLKRDENNKGVILEEDEKQ